MDVQGLNIVNGPLSSQFQNMNIESNNIDISSMSNVASIQNTQRNDGNRSISDAGLYLNPFMPSSTLRPQTAPMSSPNLYGFNYPFNTVSMFYPYNSVNNNVMYPQVTSDNLRLYVSPVTSNSSESDTPLINDNNSFATNECPNNMTSVTSSNNVMSPAYRPNPSLSPRPGAVYQPAIFPCSSSQNVPYILVPQIGSSMQNSVVNMPHGTPPRTTPSPNHHPHLSAVSECPEVELPSSEASSASMNLNFKDGLSVNVEYDDNTPHSWHPPNSGAANISYPFMSPNFHFSPTGGNPYLSHSSPKTVEQIMTSQNMPMSPMIWASTSFPMVPVATFPYPYFQVPQPDVLNLQASINHQDQILDELCSQVNNLEHEILKCQQNVQTLEKQIKDRSDLPTKLLLEKEILRLRTESLSLEQELMQAGLNEPEDNLSSSINSDQQMPLTSTDLETEEEDFYSSINTGQQGSLLPKPKKGQKKSSSKALKKQQKPPFEEEEKEDGVNNSNNWTCPHCTFLNYPGLEYCEICQKSKQSEQAIS